MKFNYALGLVGFCLVMICGAFIKSSIATNSFDLAKREVMLREIGHQVLFNSGDKTSRVLPVVKINDNEYQLQFDQQFTFQTDSLVKIINQILTRNGNSSNYIVNVTECNSKAVLFGYAILNVEKNNTKKNNIIACSGRRQPRKCYRINIKFQNGGITTLQKNYVIGSLPLLAFVGLLVYRSKSTRKYNIGLKPGNCDGNNLIIIGNSVFNADKRLFTTGDTRADLTTKETKLLTILAAAPNQIIDRRRLQKEIWEDEGVIVGRSLDMFVSKLRKKLKNDPALNLVNIHGKGYRLEVKT